MKGKKTPKKSATASIFLIIGLLGLAQIVKATEPLPKDLNEAEAAQAVKIRIKGADAEIREKPDPQSRIIGTAPSGTVLESEEKEGEWYKIAITANVYGYIHQSWAELLSETSPQTHLEESRPEIDKKPARTSPQTLPELGPFPSRKFSLKLILGFGLGFESLETGAYKVYGDRTEPITLHPGGGGSFGLDFGYQFTSNLKLELGIGYQNSGVIATGSSEEVTFSRMPLTLTLIYETTSQRSFQLYFGGGPGFYVAPEVKYDVDNQRSNIKYGPAFGFHGLVGAVKRSKSKKWFYFGEIRYVGVLGYKWTEAYLNGIWAIPSSKFRKFGANGIFLNFGLGFSF
jgi:hypothetical protein